MIDFKASNIGLNLGQLIVDEANCRNINKIRNIPLQLASKNLHLRALYRLSESNNSLGLPIKNPEEPIKKKAFFANNRSASLLNVFVDEIRAIGRRKGIKVVSFAPSTVKKYICGNGRASKKEVATVIISKYPELKVYLTQDRAWKEEFHQNMFDAVALGMMAA